MAERLRSVDDLQVHPLARIFTRFGWSPVAEMMNDAGWKKMCQRVEAIAAGGEPSKKDAALRELGWQGQKADEIPLSKLVERIKKNGLRDKIVIKDGMILDGVARYKACQQAGVALDPEVHFEYPDFASDAEALEFVLDKNVYRRHLTVAQRLEIMRRLSLGRQGPGRPGKTPPIGGVSKLKTAEVARIVGFDERTTSRLDVVARRGDPELWDMVVRQEVRPGPAEQVARLPEEEQRPVVAAGPEAVRKKAAELRARPRVTESVEGSSRRPAEEAARRRQAVALLHRHTGQTKFHAEAALQAYDAELHLSDADRERVLRQLDQTEAATQALRARVTGVSDEALARLVGR